MASNYQTAKSRCLQTRGMKLPVFVWQGYLFPKLSINILSSLTMIIRCILNLKPPKNCLLWVKSPERSTLPSQSADEHYCRMWHVLHHLFRACEHILYGVWAPLYLVPPYRKHVMCIDRVQKRSKQEFPKPYSFCTRAALFQLGQQC